MVYNVSEDDERKREPGEGILPETGAAPASALPSAPPGGTCRSRKRKAGNSVIAQTKVISESMDAVYKRLKGRF